MINNIKYQVAGDQASKEEMQKCYSFDGSSTAVVDVCE